MQTKLTKITYKDGSVTEIISERGECAVKYNAHLHISDYNFVPISEDLGNDLIEAAEGLGAKVEETIT